MHTIWCCDYAKHYPKRQAFVCFCILCIEIRISKINNIQTMHGPLFIAPRFSFPKLHRNFIIRNRWKHVQDKHASINSCQKQQQKRQNTPSRFFNCQFKNSVKTPLSHTFTILICFKIFFTLKNKKLLVTSSTTILIY